MQLLLAERCEAVQRTLYEAGIIGVFRSWHKCIHRPQKIRQLLTCPNCVEYRPPGLDVIQHQVRNHPQHISQPRLVKQPLMFVTGRIFDDLIVVYKCREVGLQGHLRTNAGP